MVLCMATVAVRILRYLEAPSCVIEKTPSAALFEGQTDETEMGVTYAELDAYIRGEEIPPEKQQKVDALHRKSQHKRDGIKKYQ